MNGAMSRFRRLSWYASVLLVAASLAVAGPLPLSVLGPDNPQTTKITVWPYQVTSSGFGGGGFTGTVGGHSTTLWCVDSQQLLYFNESVPASVHLIRNIGQSNVDPEVRSSGVINSSSPYSWKYYTTDNFWNFAKTRYTAAAWLVEKYTGFPAGPNANNAYNQGIQRAIWSLLYTTAGGGLDPGNQDTGSGSWIQQAKSAITKGYSAPGWAVLSWGVYALGTQIGDLHPTWVHQTLLVQIVPEPGFYGLLGLGLSALFFFARRRQSTAS